MNQNLSEILFQNIKRYSSHVALDIGNTTLTYAELAENARPLIQYLKKEKVSQVAILMNRGINCYIAIFACAIAGVTYMPLLKTMEKSSLEHTLQLTNTKFVITEQNFLSELDVLMTGMKQSVTCVIFDQLVLSSTYNNLPDIYSHSLPLISKNDRLVDNSATNYAYIMMTSGTTGKPKAVAVGQSQLMHYLKVIQEKLQCLDSDRFAQITELTFDLSAHDIFLCWSVGACLCPFVGGSYLELANYIQQKNISVVLMVPSMAVALERYKKIQAAYLQTIRILLFCGEPLPTTIVKKLAEVIPYAHIENIYGPTEATIAFTGFVCDQNLTERYGIVPIGKPFAGLYVAVIKNNDKSCEVGEVGELWLSGPQVVEGYLNMPEATEEKFVIKNDQLWYKSGDLVTKDRDGNLYFKGRLDDQWQIRGQRVERVDLEIQLKNLLKKTDIALIPSPVTNEGLILGVALIYVIDEKMDEMYIKKTCHKHCVSPFVPTAYFPVSDLPLNNNGKVDYKVLKLQYQKIEA